MHTLSIPNKFQALIESEDVHAYTEQERIEKSLIVSDRHLNRTLLPALVEGALIHVAQREQAILRRAGHHAVQATVEALYDSHFRKQRNYGPSRDAVLAKVEGALDRQEPITLISLMFTRKNVCTLKRSGDDIAGLDLAEIISLVHLNSFADLIARFHPHGVRYIILSEGQRFLRAFDLPNDRIHIYQSRLIERINQLNLAYLTLVDYEQFLSERLGPEALLQRQIAYEDARMLYRRLMNPVFNPVAMAQTLISAARLDPVADTYNSRNNFVPLWDSIKNSLAYPEITTLANARGVEYAQLYRELFRDLLSVQADHELEYLRRTVLRKSWDAAIEHNAQVLGDIQVGIDVAALVSDVAFRATINPKPNSPNLGIYSVRETTSRVQPWHGTAYLRADNQNKLLPTVLSKLEIEGRGGVPVCIDSRYDPPFFYVDPAAADLIQREKPVFNMSTR